MAIFGRDEFDKVIEEATECGIPLDELTYDQVRGFVRLCKRVSKLHEHVSDTDAYDIITAQLMNHMGSK